MMIRRATIQDLEQIMQIYARAVQYMQASGNPNQWVAGYPSRTLIEEDIARGVSYVVDRDSVIEAVFSYIEGEDPTYRQIEQGMWRTNGSYGTVHRLASAGRLRGVAEICFSWCAEQAKLHGCSSIRADTHQDNRIMQHLLQKNGFVYCGVIHLANGAPRLAFERTAVVPDGENPGVNPGMPNPGGENPGGMNPGRAYAGMPNPGGMNPEGAYAGMPNPGGMNPGVNAGMPNPGGMNPGMPQQKQKGDGRGYGIASLILGIVSVLLFCTCINWVTGILAIIFGIIQITKNKEHGLAIGGIITAAISMVLSVVLYLAMWFGMTNAGITYEDLLYDQYDDSYDSDGSDAWYDGDGNGSYDGGGSDGWYDDGGNDGWYDGDGSGSYDYYNDPYDYFRDYYDVQEPGGNQFM